MSCGFLLFCANIAFIHLEYCRLFFSLKLVFSEKKLIINDKNYFDITNHELRSDMFELYLTSKSKFLIGCNSGATYANLYLFKKPTYISNALPIGLAFTSSNKVITNFKSIISLLYLLNDIYSH